MSRVTRRLSTLLTFAIAPPSAAQVRIELTPEFGAYLPNTNLVETVPGSCASEFDFLGDPCGTFGAPVSIRQKTAPMVGGLITAWIGRRVGADVALGYAASTMTSVAPYSPPALATLPAVVGDTAAYVVSGSARMLYDLTPQFRRASVYLGAGVAFVKHGGVGYDVTVQTFTGSVRGRTDWGPVLGIGARYQLSRALAVRGDLENCLFVHGPSAAIAHFRGDFVASAGLSASLSPSRATQVRMRSP